MSENEFQNVQPYHIKGGKGSCSGDGGRTLSGTQGDGELVVVSRLCSWKGDGGADGERLWLIRLQMKQ